jgi:hypothetical protein
MPTSKLTNYEAAPAQSLQNWFHDGFYLTKKRIPSNILQSGAVPKQGYPATPKIIQAIRPWISIETYGVLEIRYSNRNHQIKSQLVGNGADRRLVVLRACAW